MPAAPALAQRHLTPELMDDPALDQRRHAAALRALARFNRLSRAAAILWSPIRALASVPGHPPLRILDIATGSGDIPLALTRRAHAAGLTLSIDACDVSETALAEARSRAAAAKAEVNFFRLDAIDGQLPGDYDVVMCSLFMHHLEEPQVIDLLYRMRCAARTLVLVSDLRRSRWGYTLAAACSRLFTSSEVARADALKSVRAAFTPEEFAQLAAGAGLSGAVIEPVWPCRFRLTWRRE
jgi:2-polyprenyl-3-methyl-5-hydroxy-6-metoxy-1,4-benzoquinol methylase